MPTTTIFHIGQRLTDRVNVDVLVERVARGGFGEVAMGPDQLREGRWLAIKVLRPDLLTQLGLQPGNAAYAVVEARLRASFLQEALTWRGLWPHVNLLTAQFVLEINHKQMLVLDYAEQGSLRDLFTTALRQGKWLPVADALNLAQHIAAGLVALHTPAPDLLRDQPIVHRDLKPENILLSRNRAMITDFGLATAVTQMTMPPSATQATTHSLPPTQMVPTATQVYPTQRGAVLGTPAYMAPEQWQDASLVGTHADAYAFGLIVCELLTGRHPLLPLDDHRLTQEDWRQAHRVGRPLPLRRLGAALFADERASQNEDWGVRQEAALEQVEGLVARLLAKVPAVRPTLGEALAGLRAAAEELGEMPIYTLPENFYPPTEAHQMMFWQGWANSYYQFGLYAEALPRAERALALTPQHPKVLISHAAILTGLGRVEEALAVARQALTQTPDDDQRDRAICWNSIGISLVQLRRYAEAEAALTETLQLDPALADAWYNRAAIAEFWARTEMGARQMGAAQVQVEAGLAHIGEARRLNPEYPGYRQLEQGLLQLREALRGQG